MTPSVQNYYIDPKKSGAVLRAFIDQRGLSLSTVATETGIDYDTLRNYLSGKIQKVTIDCLLKILFVTEHTLDDYFRAYAQLDDTILVYQQVFVPDKSPDTSEKSTAHPVKISDAPLPASGKCHAMEQYIDRLDQSQERMLSRISAQYQDQISQLKESRAIMRQQYDDELALLEKRHDKSVQHLKDQITKLEKRCTRLMTVLIVENILVGGVLFYDALNRNVGWIRSLFHTGDSIFAYFKS